MQDMLGDKKYHLELKYFVYLYLPCSEGHRHNIFVINIIK